LPLIVIRRGACLALGALVVVAGCGEVPGPKKAAQPAKKAKAETPPPPPKIEVKPDAFASVPEALDAIVAAQSANDQKQILIAEEWIRLQGAGAGPILAETLKNDEAPLAARIAACRGLSRLGPSVGKAPLLAALDSSNAQLLNKACESLALMKPHDPQVVAKLIALVDSKDPQLRLKAVNGLAFIGPAAKEAGPKLLAILNSQQEDDTLRAAAKAALKSCAPRKTFSDQ
jgi:HEAT repeat protein